LLGFEVVEVTDIDVLEELKKESEMKPEAPKDRKSVV
jgi:hypothetical protein